MEGSSALDNSELAVRGLRELAGRISGSTLAGWAVVLLTGVTALKRLVGLDPASLWIDDTWVALAATHMSPAEILQLRVPTPVGFTSLLALAARASDDPEWPLQLLPWIASLLVVPFLYTLVYRLTSCRTSALLGAALAASNPLLATYSSRVKPYGTDLLISTSLLWLAVSLATNWNLRRVGILLACCAIAPFFSFPSVFLSLAIANALAIVSLTAEPRGTSQRREALLLAAGVNTAALAIALTYLGPSSNPDLLWYWREYFPDTSSLGGWVEFFTTRYREFLYQPFPFPATLFVLILPFGLLRLWRQTTHRALALCLLLLQVGVISAAALGRVPLGTGRTDIFSLSCFWVMACVGVAGLHFPLRLLFAAAALFGLTQAAPARYPEVADKQTLTAVEERMRPSDGLLLYGQATWSAAYYGPWPFHFASGEWGHGYDVAFEREHTTQVPPRDDLLAKLIGSGPQRWFYVTVQSDGKDAARLGRIMSAQGFRETWWKGPERGAMAILFERGRDETTGRSETSSGESGSIEGGSRSG